MSLKYQTKPLTLSKNLDKIWEILLEQDEQIQKLQQEVYSLKQQVKELRRSDTSDEADTKRLN